MGVCPKTRTAPAQKQISDLRSLSITVCVQVLTQTLDPFSGVLYVQPSRLLRRGEQGPGHCRTEGRGRHQLEMTVKVGQCGWRQEGERVRLNVYMQYDPHVQQVIDEQLEVECNMASRVGRVVETSQRGLQHTNIPVSAVQTYGVATSLSHEEEQEEQEVEEEAAPAPAPAAAPLAAPAPRVRQGAERRVLDEPAVSPMAGWLDITNNGRQILEPLLEGDAVKLTAKVKLSGRKETMITRCLMATASGDVTELTDEFGCSTDLNLVSDFTSIINDITGVKESRADFFVPLLSSGRKMESVRIKCNLVVCTRHCPIISCDGENQPIRVEDSAVLETQAVISRTDMINVLEQSHSQDTVQHSFLPQDDSTLCLSPTRLVLAFGVLIVVIIISLLFSCYLWMKARKRMMPRGPMPIQRVPYMMPNRARPYIRVMT